MGRSAKFARCYPVFLCPPTRLPPPLCARTDRRRLATPSRSPAGRPPRTGEYFVQTGDYRPVLALLLQGTCRLYYPRLNGEERTTYFFFENHFLADYSGCLTGQPSQLSIQALVDSELVVFDYAVLRQLYHERPVYERFGSLLTKYHLLGTDARLTEQLLLSPEERYWVNNLSEVVAHVRFLYASPFGKPVVTRG